MQFDLQIRLDVELPYCRSFTVKFLYNFYIASCFIHLTVDSLIRKYQVFDICESRSCLGKKTISHRFFTEMLIF